MNRFLMFFTYALIIALLIIGAIIFAQMECFKLAGFLLLAVFFVSLTSESKSKRAIQMEYKSDRFKMIDCQHQSSLGDKMNREAEKGWRIFKICVREDYFDVVFEREKKGGEK